MKKLKALADKGVGGEKENAESMLKRLMEKHGVSIEEIEEDQKIPRDLKFTKKNEQLFWQILSHIMGGAAQYRSHKNSTTRIRIEMTSSEHIEFEAKMNFFQKKFEEDFSIFYRAFIHKNDLFSKPSDLSSEPKEMTPEEIDEYFKVKEMMQGMKKHNHSKLLGESTTKIN